MSGVVSIDVHSDISCPWCFIGGRRLQRVLREMTPDIRVEVRHHPYLLHPDAPQEGLNVHARLAERYGRLIMRLRSFVRTRLRADFEFAKVRPSQIIVRCGLV